ncbi:hypothetical protein MTR_1g038670 [Medicago truncatula]|uniref:Uncharacterized protein n=1 Tax=Medicago truncatula TaxID=3880 RepID=G7IBF5_MEDTR|nr:hypothetical protein MTR_1g038670 [Medicago truncatula]
MASGAAAMSLRGGTKGACKHDKKPSCLASRGKELIPRTYSGNTEFDFQGEQRLASTHAFTHEPD